MPIFSRGLAALSASTVGTSDAKDGVEVCSTTRSRSFASRQHVGEREPVRRRVDQLASPRPSRPAAPARSGTRTTGSRGGPDSARRRRHRSRRTTAPAETACAWRPSQMAVGRSSQILRLRAGCHRPSMRKSGVPPMHRRGRRSSSRTLRKTRMSRSGTQPIGLRGKPNRASMQPQSRTRGKRRRDDDQSRGRTCRATGRSAPAAERMGQRRAGIAERIDAPDRCGPSAARAAAPAGARLVSTQRCPHRERRR